MSKSVCYLSVNGDSVTGQTVFFFYFFYSCFKEFVIRRVPELATLLLSDWAQVCNGGVPNRRLCKEQCQSLKECGGKSQWRENPGLGHGGARWEKPVPGPEEEWWDNPTAGPGKAWREKPAEGPGGT